jgi:enoyl-[acyl-carrier protein] reductase I
MNDQSTELPEVAIQSKVLHGKRALVIGIANEHSIAYGCARVFRQLGADLAVTYLNDKARPYVEPLAKDLGASIFAPCDVGRNGELEAVFQQIGESWGSLLDSSGEGFKVAMDISCHSFVRMARLAEPLMTNGGTLLAMSYHGANKVVPNYNLMGPVKAALESAVRYLAYELGEKHIRVHAVSPGPLKTRAASGLKDFDVLLSEAIERAPIGELVDIEDVGLTAAYLTTPFARRLTGTTTYVDGGLSIMA